LIYRTGSYITAVDKRQFDGFIYTTVLVFD